MRFLILLGFFLAAHVMFAQSARQDSITHRYDSLSKIKLKQADSTSNKVNKKIDATQSKINNIASGNFNGLFSKEQLSNKKRSKDSLHFYQQQEAQKKILQHKIDSLEHLQLSADHYHSQLDSVSQLQFTPRKKKELPKVNPTSLQSRVQRKQQQHDSIRFQKKIDKEKIRVQSQIDSLHQQNLPTEKYDRQLDSLEKITYTPPHRLQNTRHRIDSLKSIQAGGNIQSKLDSINPLHGNKQVSELQSKANTLEKKINQPADKLEGAVNEKLNLMRQEGGANANLPSNASLPATTLPDGTLQQTTLPSGSLPTMDNPLQNIDNPLDGKMKEAGELTNKTGTLKELPQQQVAKLKSADQLQEAQSKLGQANAITDKAQGYSADAKSIAKGDLNEVKELPKAAEQQMGKLGMNDLQKETGKFDQYKQMADKAKDPAALKEEALRQAPKLAVNHFAGKEAALQSAMEQMSKLKTKYESLNSLKDIPKRSRNMMRGKPFIERLVPGVTFQFQRSGDFLLDYNPYIGYRFYGRFTAGAGWNERVGISKHIHFSLKERIYGPRVYADFMLGKGFSVRTDIEKMNTYVPALTGNGYSTTDGYRAWVWSAFVGIRKEYKFMKNVKGTAQFLYNFYDDHNNSPYADRIVVRMGFEWKMKKKVKAVVAKQ